MLSKSDISSLAVVKRGRQRRLVVKNMDADKPLMVSEIERRTNEYIKKIEGRRRTHTAERREQDAENLG